MGVSVQYSLACPVVYFHCTRESWFSLNLFQNAYFRQSKWKKITLHVLRDSYESHVFKVHFFANFFQFFKTFDLMCRHAFHNSGMSSQRVCRRPVSMPFKRDESRWIIFSRKDFFWREGDFLATTTTCIIESVSCWYVYEIIRIICIPRVMARAKRDHSYGSVIKKNIFASIRSQL